MDANLIGWRKGCASSPTTWQPIGWKRLRLSCFLLVQNQFLKIQFLLGFIALICYVAREYGHAKISLHATFLFSCSWWLHLWSSSSPICSVLYVVSYTLTKEIPRNIRNIAFSPKPRLIFLIWEDQASKHNHLSHQYLDIQEIVSNLETVLM